MTWPIGQRLSRTTVPFSLIVYALHGTWFCHPCDNPTEQREFVAGMRDAYAPFVHYVYYLSGGPSA